MIWLVLLAAAAAWVVGAAVGRYAGRLKPWEPLPRFPGVPRKD